jgi:hypothetical protein
MICTRRQPTGRSAQLPKRGYFNLTGPGSPALRDRPGTLPLAMFKTVNLESLEFTSEPIRNSDPTNRPNRATAFGISSEELRVSQEASGERPSILHLPI